MQNSFVDHTNPTLLNPGESTVRLYYLELGGIKSEGNVEQGIYH